MHVKVRGQPHAVLCGISLFAYVEILGTKFRLSSMLGDAVFSESSHSPSGLLSNLLALDYKGKLHSPSCMIYF